MLKELRAAAWKNWHCTDLFWYTWPKLDYFWTTPKAMHLSSSLLHPLGSVLFITWDVVSLWMYGREKENGSAWIYSTQTPAVIALQATVSKLPQTYLWHFCSVDIHADTLYHDNLRLAVTSAWPIYSSGYSSGQDIKILPFENLEPADIWHFWSTIYLSSSIIKIVVY